MVVKDCMLAKSALGQSNSMVSAVLETTCATGTTCSVREGAGPRTTRSTTRRVSGSRMKRVDEPQCPSVQSTAAFRGTSIMGASS